MTPANFKVSDTSIWQNLFKGQLTLDIASSWYSAWLLCLFLKSAAMGSQVCWHLGNYLRLNTCSAYLLMIGKYHMSTLPKYICVRANSKKQAETHVHKHHHHLLEHKPQQQAPTSFCRLFNEDRAATVFGVSISALSLWRLPPCSVSPIITRERSAVNAATEPVPAHHSWSSCLIRQRCQHYFPTFHCVQTALQQHSAAIPVGKANAGEVHVVRTWLCFAAWWFEVIYSNCRYLNSDSNSCKEYKAWIFIKVAHRCGEWSGYRPSVFEAPSWYSGCLQHCCPTMQAQTENWHENLVTSSRIPMLPLGLIACPCWPQRVYLSAWTWGAWIWGTGCHLGDLAGPWCS